MTSPLTPEQITAARDQVSSYLNAEGHYISTSLGGLAEMIFYWNSLQGFWPAIPRERNVGEALALIHSEVSEALEAHRRNTLDDKLPNRPGLEVELADAIIRILDLSAGLGLNVSGALIDKLHYNLNRPFRHGKEY